jgi:hypothetical protein
MFYSLKIRFEDGLAFRDGEDKRDASADCTYENWNSDSDRLTWRLLNRITSYRLR